MAIPKRENWKPGGPAHKPAFIIGNGPSLTPADLDLIAATDGAISYATNRIQLIFPRTTWRPTHYVRAENPWATKEIVYADLIAIFKLGIVSYLNRGFETAWRMCMGSEAPTSRVEFMPNSCEHTLMRYDDEGLPDEWHDPLCMFGGSLFVAMQIAAYDGYNPLILLGCDLGYKDGEPSHFDPKYEDGYGEHLMPADLANGNCYAAHVLAASSCPVPILNATRGAKDSNLAGIYPIVKLEDVLKGEYEHTTDIQAEEPQAESKVRAAPYDYEGERYNHPAPREKASRRKGRSVHG